VFQYNTIKNMKILVFFTYGYSIKTWSDSGVLEREFEIYRFIANKFNVKFTFVTFGNNSDIELNIDNELFEVIPIYTLIKYNKNPLLRYIKSFIIPFKLRHTIQDKDVLHQHQLLGSWIPIISKLIYKKPLLVRTGYDMYEFALKENKSKFIKILYKILTNLSLKYSNLFTVTSSSDLKRLNPKYRIKKRSNWVYNLTNNDFDNRYENRLLCVGRLVSQKNYEYLLNEFKNTKDWLVIDIYGSGEKKEELIKKAKLLKVNINIFENINNIELLKVYNRYKFYVSTSKFEGNPKSLLEAMASGCVCFTSNIPNHTEIINNKHNGYIFDLSKNSLRLLFEIIFKEQNNLKNISMNANKEITASNSIDLIANYMYEDYLDIIK